MSRVGVAASVLLALLLPARLSAQGAEQHQSIGEALTSASPKTGHVLDINWKVSAGHNDFAGHNDNALSDNGQVPDPRLQVGGAWYGTALSLRFVSRSRGTTWATDGAISMRDYPTGSTLNAVDGVGMVAFSADLGRKATLAVAQRGGYQPYYQFRYPSSLPFDVAGSPVEEEFLVKQETRFAEGGVQLVEKLGRRSSLTADYGYRFSQLNGAAAPFRWQFASGTFRRQVTRFGGIRLGYGLGEAKDGYRVGTPVTKTQNLDIGVEYSRPLSSSRKTAFAFGSGSSAISYQTAQYYRLIADAALTRALSPRWFANLAYHRGVSFSEGLIGPLYADTFQAGANGVLKGRFGLRVTAAYANGQMGVAAFNRYIAESFGTDFSVAIGARLSFVTRYTYFHYDIDPAVQVPFGLGHMTSRQTVRFSLAGSLPHLR